VSGERGMSDLLEETISLSDITEITETEGQGGTQHGTPAPQKVGWLVSIIFRLPRAPATLSRVQSSPELAIGCL
jgi:hypothetical protein